MAGIILLVYTLMIWQKNGELFEHVSPLGQETFFGGDLLSTMDGTL